MNEETRDFLAECKKAGYTFISIGVKDKRVPSSMKIEWYGERKFCSTPNTGGYTGGIPQCNLEGEQTGWQVRPHVVCGEPNCRDSGRPAIWDICKSSVGRTEGGCSETHGIRYDHILNLGVYDITGNEPQLIGTTFE